MEATINGARIHYVREGDGLPLVFLHAGVADNRMWEPQLHFFSQWFEVVAADIRGFGQSELPAGHWFPPDDVLGLIEHLHLKPVHLVGCSMGGGIAIDFALEHGERISKLVLVGPGVGGRNFGAKYPEVFAESEAAEKSGDHRAMVEADAHLWLDGPRRQPGYVKDPIRKLFFEMDSNFDSDWDSGADRPHRPARRRALAGDHRADADRGRRRRRPSHLRRGGAVDGEPSPRAQGGDPRRRAPSQPRASGRVQPDRSRVST